MTAGAAWCAVALVALTGPEGQRIDIAPMMVVSVRPVRAGVDHFGPHARCILSTVDGRLIILGDDCETVRRRLDGGP